MPPWKPEPGAGEFAGARRLTATEIDLFQRWAAEGGHLGDASVLPPAPDHASPWRLGEPDLIVTMPEPYTVRASGPDVYRNFVIPLALKGRRYVKAWEFRPGNTRVVHHATLQLDTTQSSRRMDKAKADPEPGYEGLVASSVRSPDGFFLDWAPGHTPFKAPDGIAWPIEANSDLVLMLHLRPTGQQEKVQASVALYLTEVPPTRIPVMLRLNRDGLDIAAGDRDYVVTDSFTLPVDVDVYTVQPHAHYLAREIDSSATLPDASVQRLISIKDWDFDWQDVYQYARPVSLPRGTTITMRWRYDNSALNRRNPNQPPQRVTYGQRTSDEMSELWFQVVPKQAADRELLSRSIRAKVLPEEIKGFELMTAADPSNVALHDDAALLYAEAGDFVGAARHFGESLRLRPDSPAAHFNVGTALVVVGRKEEAALQFRAALAADPNYVRALRSLAALLLAGLDAGPPGVPNATNAVEEPNGNAVSEAVSLAARAAALSPSSDYEVLDLLGTAYAAAGQLERAVESKEKALAGATNAGALDRAAAIRAQLAEYRSYRKNR
jgi:Flp pilus assembly protein TadD